MIINDGLIELLLLILKSKIQTSVTSLNPRIFSFCTALIFCQNFKTFICLLVFRLWEFSAGFSFPASECQVLSLAVCIRSGKANVSSFSGLKTLRIPHLPLNCSTRFVLKLESRSLQHCAERLKLLVCKNYHWSASESFKVINLSRTTRFWRVNIQ